MTTGPWREPAPRMRCDACQRETFAISRNVHAAPYFPWRESTLGLCNDCADREAWVMLSAAERRVCELETQLRETRWYQRLWSWIQGGK